MYKKILFYTLLSSTACVMGFYAGSKLYSFTNQVNAIVEKPNNEIPVKQADAGTENTVTENTRIIYQYYYTEDGTTEVYEELAPYYLIKLNREKLEEKMWDWQVLKFSSNEVILQRSIASSGEQGYVIGKYDGFVAVFYDKPVDGEHIMEITDLR